MASGGRGACWIVITGNHKYAFVTNSLSTFPPGDGKGGIARYAVATDGTLTLLGQTDVTPSSPPGAAFPTDLTLSPDSRYLYVLVADAGHAAGAEQTTTRATSTSTGSAATAA